MPKYIPSDQALCQTCTESHDAEFVTLDIVSKDDLVRRQQAIGPFCKRCANSIFNSLRLCLNTAADEQKKRAAVELQASRQADEQQAKAVEDALTPFTHTTERPGIYTEGPNVKD